jgi:hypothetical protein
MSEHHDTNRRRKIADRLTTLQIWLMIAGLAALGFYAASAAKLYTNTGLGISVLFAGIGLLCLAWLVKVAVRITLRLPWHGRIKRYAEEERRAQREYLEQLEKELEQAEKELNREQGTGTRRLEPIHTSMHREPRGDGDARGNPRRTQARSTRTQSIKRTCPNQAATRITSSSSSGPAGSRSLARRTAT